MRVCYVCIYNIQCAHKLTFFFLLVLVLHKTTKRKVNNKRPFVLSLLFSKIKHDKINICTNQRAYNNIEKKPELYKKVADPIDFWVSETCFSLDANFCRPRRRVMTVFSGIPFIFIRNMLFISIKYRFQNGTASQVTVLATSSSKQSLSNIKQKLSKDWTKTWQL